jgi:ATP-binding cassette subfamily B protein
MNLGLLHKTFVRQQAVNDCGVACLQSIIQFHGGSVSLEDLRAYSGTTVDGSSLLGLYQAASQVGFDAEGLEAGSINDLRSLDGPAILAVLIQANVKHYIVYYGMREEKIMIGDPAKGVQYFSVDELDQIWTDRELLSLTPNDNFVKTKAERSKQLRYLFSFLRPELSLLAISLGLGLVTAALELSSAIFSQRLIDKILPEHNTKKLVLSIIFLCVLLLVRVALGFVRGFYLIEQSKQFNLRIVGHFYRSLLNLPKSFFDSRRTGELVARMNDTTKVNAAVRLLFGNLVISYFLLSISILLIAAYSLLLAGIVVAFLGAYVLTLLKFNGSIASSQREVMIQYAHAEANYVDSIQGVATIKSMQSENRFINLSDQIYGNVQQSLVKLGKTNNVYLLVAEILAAFFLTSVFILGSLMVLNQDLKIGEMVAIIAISINIGPLATRILVANVEVQEAKAALERMVDIVQRPGELEARADSALQSFDKLILKVENLAFRFNGCDTLLNNISFTVCEGEIISIKGKSGGGKSTLLQILQGFYQAEEGQITLNNTALQDLSLKNLRSIVVPVSQEVKIFNGTILENITLNGSEVYNLGAIQHLVEVGLHEYFEQFPNGYLTLVGEEGIKLSGGQKQVLGLARALVRRPKLLLLDESTAALDSETEELIVNTLQYVRRNAAIIFVSHRMNIIEIADRAYELENGALTLLKNEISIE